MAAAGRVGEMWGFTWCVHASLHNFYPSAARAETTSLPRDQNLIFLAFSQAISGVSVPRVGWKRSMQGVRRR